MLLFVGGLLAEDHLPRPSSSSVRTRPQLTIELDDDESLGYCSDGDGEILVENVLDTVTGTFLEYIPFAVEDEEMDGYDDDESKAASPGTAMPSTPSAFSDNGTIHSIVLGHWYHNFYSLL